MKKVNKLLMTLLPSAFLLGLTSCSSNGKTVSLLSDPLEETHAEFSKNPEASPLDRPDISNRIRADEGGEGEDVDPEIVVDKVILHYYNEAGGNLGRAFYLWVTGVDGVEYNFENASDIMECSSDGTMMTINIDFKDPRFTKFAGKTKLFFIIKYKKISDTNLNWGGQSDDMQLVYSEFPPKDKSTTCEVWTMPAAGGGIAILESEEETKVHGVQLAKFTKWNKISCELTKDTKRVNWELYAFDETYFKIKPKKRETAKKWYLVKSGSATGKFDITLKYKIHMNMVYSLVSHDPDTDSNPKMAKLNKTVTVGFDKLYETTEFRNNYENATINSPKALGVTYAQGQTTFRVWSPASANVTLMLYESDTSTEFGGDDLYDGYHMYYTAGGVWEKTITGDVAGKYYNYQVDNVLGTNVCMDPYATSAGTCGVRGFVYDKENTKPDFYEGEAAEWDALKNKWHGDSKYDISSPQDLSIYEVHMQDFTGDDSWVSKKSNRRGTYKAFVESGTTYTYKGSTVTTGYDHLNELGVKAVQLVPVFDSDNDESAVFDEDGNPTKQVKYNWGYNPLNYNVVEGGYSSDPSNGLARVKEFKHMILQLSKTDAHTRTIMDVVYNHVSSATGSAFHKLMPRYYFRYAQNDYYYTNEHGQQIKYQSAGELWDGSGCHNEVASERPMMRKFIVDSLKMWATDYQIKGFRFDLMGLIDYKTMIEAKKAMAAIDDDIYLYGEGWSLGYHGEGSDQWNYEHGIKGDNFGTENWQIYNECNNFETQGVYLGGFNNAFRDAVKGDNGSKGEDDRTYPNAGFIQNGNWKQDINGNWYCDYGTLDRIAKGMWGTNCNVNTDGNLTGHYPEQTINYVSCHDNWTVRDQLYQTLHQSSHATAEELITASIQAHSLVFASNSAAFMLGGEELFRTKEFTMPESEIPSEVTLDSYTKLYGHNISHNSYNAPLSVNTFKWGNKVEIDVDGDIVTNASKKYVAAFKDLIALHAKTPKKAGKNVDANTFYGITSADNPVYNIYWSQTDNFSNCVAFQCNETFVYTCAGAIGEGDYIQCQATELDQWRAANGEFVFGDTSYSGTRFYFGKTNSVRVFVRG